MISRHLLWNGLLSIRQFNTKQSDEVSYRNSRRYWLSHAPTFRLGCRFNEFTCCNKWRVKPCFSDSGVCLLPGVQEETRLKLTLRPMSFRGKWRRGQTHWGTYVLMCTAWTRTIEGWRPGRGCGWRGSMGKNKKRGAAIIHSTIKTN